MKIKIIFISHFILFLLSLNLWHFDIAHSSQLENYTIKKCSKSKVTCWKATGLIGFIASNGDTLAAKDVDFVIKNKNYKNLKYNCNSFILNLGSGSIICDNSELKNTVSLFVDRNFKINEIK